jgi:hypothetical protein
MKWIKTETGAAIAGLFMGSIFFTVVAIAATWTIPSTSQSPIWSPLMTTQITSGSDSGSVTIDGHAYIHKFSVTTANLPTTTAVIKLYDLQGNEYFASSDFSVGPDSSTVVDKVDEDIAGLTTATISLSTPTVTGGGEVSWKFLVGREK